MQAKINTNFPGISLSDVKVIVKKQTTDKIDAIYDFPNGFQMHTITTCDGISVECNWLLRKESDGSLTPVPPKQD